MSDYSEDLAYIHDAGFRDYALGAAPGLLAILRRHRVTTGRVIDLGCGGGRWAAAAGAIIDCMPVSADVLRLHLDYTAWASQKLLDAATQLPPEQLHHDFGTANRSILGTLLHVYGGDHIWLSRLAGEPHPAWPIPEEQRTLAVLQTDWPAVLERWRLWAARLTDEGAQALLDYRDLKGNPYRQPVWQLVLHVVNHGTHHRGQASGFLRALGHTPPQLDLVSYYRQMK